MNVDKISAARHREPRVRFFEYSPQHPHQISTQLSRGTGKGTVLFEMRKHATTAACTTGSSWVRSSEKIDAPKNAAFCKAAENVGTFSQIPPQTPGLSTSRGDKCAASAVFIRHRMLMAFALCFLGISSAWANCSSSGGIFGTWFSDANELPAFRYTLAQDSPTYGGYPTTQFGQRREHWHHIGNDRLTAMAYNDGYIVLSGQERGPVLYNRFAPHQQNYAGGFSFVNDSEETWATAYAYRPRGAKVHREFGAGYTTTGILYRDIAVTRRTYAPRGDSTFLISEISLHNTGTTPRTLEHYEYWDANQHQLAIQPMRTGKGAYLWDVERDAINASFVDEATWDAQNHTLRIHKHLKKRPEGITADTPSTIDYFPADIFLTDLTRQSLGHFVDQKRFFGSAGPSQPHAVVKKLRPDALPVRAEGKGQQFLLVLKSTVYLAPGEQQSLKYAYGYAWKRNGTLEGAIRQALAPEQSPASWKDRLPRIAVDDDCSLDRELQWKAYQLLSSTGFRDYFDLHIVPQGSAYLYLHGVEGAPRDQALFSLPLTFLDPALTRDQLLFIMRMTKAEDGGIYYGLAGHGKGTSMGLHRYPSDLDLFFLMALSHYLAATGDKEFLREMVPFYPKEAPPPKGIASNTVLDHARAAIRHLYTTIGFGTNGLIRIGDGDWHDGIVLENALRSANLHVEYGNSVRYGESIYNSALALYALPFFADLIEDSDPNFAATIREPLAALRTATLRQFNGKWFNRAILRNILNKPVVIGKDNIDLAAQVWPLIAGLLGDSERRTLIEEIRKQLDLPSPTGAMEQPGGLIWPALSHLLTWGYALQNEPAFAWEQLRKTSYAQRAQQFPDNWIGIWSAPDALYPASYAPNPGGTWASPVTPMTDFPVMNNNADAMWILGLLRASGISSHPKGIAIDLRNPTPAQRLDFPLLSTTFSERAISGIYRAANNGSLFLHIALPSNASDTPHATVKGRAVDIPNPRANDTVQLKLQFTRSEEVPFTLEY